MSNIPDVSDLIGVPFEKMNCWQLVKIVQERFGNIVPDYTIAAEASAQINAAFNMDLNKWQLLRKPEPGCVIAMAIDPDYPGVIQHFGVCLGKMFIHTYSGANSCLTPMNHAFFARKMKGFGKWKKNP